MNILKSKRIRYIYRKKLFRMMILIYLKVKITIMPKENNYFHETYHQ